MGRRQRVDARYLPSTSTPQGRHDSIVGYLLAKCLLYETQWHVFGVLHTQENDTVTACQLQ